MTDVIMTPGSGNQDSGGSNAILGVIVGIILVLVLIYFFVPGIRSRFESQPASPTPVQINLGGSPSPTPAQ